MREHFCADFRKTLSQCVMVYYMCNSLLLVYFPFVLFYQCFVNFVFILFSFHLISFMNISVQVFYL